MVVSRVSERVTRMLKNYKSYKYAISNGIEPYEEGEIGTGCGGYGSRIPKLTRGSTWQTELEYRAYKRVVNAIDGAVREVLDDDMQAVIKYKYLERNTLTLAQIAERLHCHEQRAKYLHKKALKELHQALIFVQEPEIINVDFHLNMTTA